MLKMLLTDILLNQCSEKLFRKTQWISLIDLVPRPAALLKENPVTDTFLGISRNFSDNFYRAHRLGRCF